MSEEDYNAEDQEIDDLLDEEGDDEEDLLEEEIVPEKPHKKKERGRGRPKGRIKKKEVPEQSVSAEPIHEKMNWQKVYTAPFNGYQNAETGEVIEEGEVLQRILCYAEEAAKNSR